MTTPRNNKNAGLYIIVGVVFVSLITIGIMLMIQSHKIYDQSYQQSGKLAERVFDTTFKKQITLITPNYTSIKDGYGQALPFFTLAIGVLLFLMLLPRLQNLSIGPGGINLTLKDLQQNVETLIKHANSMQAESVGEGGRKVVSGDIELIKKESKGSDDKFPNDPQKGKWGGEAEKNYRKLSAVVTDSNHPGFYIVKIKVESTNKKFPLTGIVKFHLHDTFINPNPVTVAENGIAVLNLTKVYGAFTAGVETDDGDTKLELDLAELKDAPKGFRER
jgi:hypothetical protein